jgi:hypothetical protein
MSDFLLNIIRYIFFSLALFFIVPVLGSESNWDAFDIYRSGIFSCFFMLLYFAIGLKGRFTKFNIAMLIVYFTTFVVFIFVYDMAIQAVQDLSGGR